jgi:hypothetical protein
VAYTNSNSLASNNFFFYEAELSPAAKKVIPVENYIIHLNASDVESCANDFLFVHLKWLANEW